MIRELKYFKLDMNRTIEVGFLKGMWRKIAVQLHPDKGGSEEQFKLALQEYDYLLEHVGAIYTARQDSPDSYNSWNDFFAHVSPHVRECYDHVNGIPNINVIEICGEWIWVTLSKEQTADREQLKAINVNGTKFKFSANKSKWYWAGRKSSNRGRKFSMDEIRAWHGSKVIRKEEEQYSKIAA